MRIRDPQAFAVWVVVVGALTLEIDLCLNSRHTYHRGSAPC
jgi:hypothetical protein